MTHCRGHDLATIKWHVFESETRLELGMARSGPAPQKAPHSPDVSCEANIWPQYAWTNLDPECACPELQSSLRGTERSWISLDMD